MLGGGAAASRLSTHAGRRHAEVVLTGPGFGATLSRLDDFDTAAADLPGRFPRSKFLNRPAPFPGPPSTRHSRYGAVVTVSSPNGSLVVADGVSKRYGSGEAAVDALVGVSTGFDRGRFTAIMGPSGRASRP